MGDDNEVDRTLWCGNLSDEVTEELLYELFLQVNICDGCIIAQFNWPHSLPYLLILSFPLSSSDTVSTRIFLVLYTGVLMYND